jgi:hypothetical protein
MKHIQNIDILPGAAGIKAAYEKSLMSDNIDIICLSRFYTTVIGDYFDRVYAPKLYSQRIVTREVVLDTVENRRDATGKDPILHTVRYMQELFPSESDFLVFDDTIAVISYNPDSPQAVLFHDPAIVSHFRNQFTAIWNSLE